MNWRRAVVATLATMKAIDLLKESFLTAGLILPEPVKSAAAIGVGVALTDGEPRERAVMAFALASSAGILHEVRTLVTTATDQRRQLFLQRGVRAAANSLPGRGPRVQSL